MFVFAELTNLAILVLRVWLLFIELRCSVAQPSYSITYINR
jgi:hypothetical protein